MSNTKKIYAGTAYTSGCSLHENDNRFVVIRVTPDSSKFPYKVRNQDCILNDRIEAVVFVTAHELRHLWQKKYPYAKRLGGYGMFSEVDATKYAIQKLNEWKKRKGAECLAKMVQRRYGCGNEEK